MDYFSKFLRTSNQPPSVKTPVDYAQEFHKSWISIKNILRHPDERQLTKGIKSTDVPAQLKSMVDALVWESTRTEAGGTGACLEYLLKNDVLDTLVRLSENDRPSGIQVEVLRTVQNMVILLDEQFLVHSAVHRAVLRLLRNCVGDDMEEQLDNRNKVMGAARKLVRSQPSEYEEDLNLLCVLCGRIRTFRDLLIIFFHDKHWYRSDPLFSAEEDEDEEDGEESIDRKEGNITTALDTASDSGSITPTSSTMPAPVSSSTTKPEYEFLLFNYLLRFVHREGQIGDFARAGLLFIMDIAMSPGEQAHRIASDETHSVTIEISGTTQSASTDPISDAALALAEYILDGDFSDVLAAGLSAVYSLLPRKLEFPPQFRIESGSGSGMVLGRKAHESEEEKELWEASYQKSLALGIEEANNADFRSRLDHFLKLLEFIQDILRRNTMQEAVDTTSSIGSAIVQSILDSIRRVFLENVLYPSILECSDIDGSAVAVMSYIETIARMMPDGHINDLFADFLVSEDNDEARSKQRQPHDTIFTRLEKNKRRKSSAMVLLEMEVPESRKKSQYFTSMGRFTLKDLILANLKSQSQSAATCALQLLQTMLIRQPQLSIDKILLVTLDPNATAFPRPPMTSEDRQAKDDEDEWEINQFSLTATPEPLSRQPDTTLTTHEREMELYLSLVSRVDRSHEGDVFSTGYDHYLRDSILGISSQPAFFLTGADDADHKSRLNIKHHLNATDPILTLLLDWLRTFFSNTPEFNLALTGALAILAMHPDRSMAGWLTFGTSNVSSVQDFRPARSSSPKYEGDLPSFDYTAEEKLCNDELFLPAARMDENTRPVIHTIFHGLVTQLDKYRQMVDDFDKYLLERRQGLLFSESLTDALNIALDIGGEPVTTTQPIEIPSKSKSKSIIASSSSLVSFLSPRKSKVAKSSNDKEDITRRKQAESQASPFGGHYQITSGISLESFIASAPSSGPWAPRKAMKWGVEDEDVFTSSWSDRSEDSLNDSRHEKDAPERRTVTVTLSQLLDNVVILEESIKELVSIMHARRSLGIDAVRYL
ncbi:Retinoic acid induced 16-like domain containing protein [Amanita muscaria]